MSCTHSGLSRASSSLSSGPFRTLHLEDPWTLPSLCTSSEDSRLTKMNMPLSTTLVAYQANIGDVVDPSPSSSWTEEEDPYALPALVVVSSHSHDCLDDIFLTDEAILEAMPGLEKPSGELHHRSYFLPKIDDIECDEYKAIFSEKIGRFVVPLGSPSKYVEGNMANLSPTIHINISRVPGKVENVYIGVDCSPDEIKECIELFKEFRDMFAWSYGEMSGIYPRIV